MREATRQALRLSTEGKCLASAPRDTRGAVAAGVPA